MSNSTYTGDNDQKLRPLVWLGCEVKSPPFSANARQDAGELLGKLQAGLALAMPQSRPMPSIGSHCHELRVDDGMVCWRIFYCLDKDAILVMGVFQKKTRTTPLAVTRTCKARLAHYWATLHGR